jgi:hypothetical protein
MLILLYHQQPREAPALKVKVVFRKSLSQGYEWLFRAIAIIESERTAVHAAIP